MLTPRLLPLLAVAASLALSGPASAATTRHATPSGAGTVCTANAPCTLEEALDDAQNGDEIVVHAGVHDVDATAGFGTLQNLNVHGAAGEPRPEVRAAVDGCGLSVGAGSRVSGLRVRPWLAHNTAICATGGVTIEQVVVDGDVLMADGLGLGTPNGALVRGVSIRLTGSGSRGIAMGSVRAIEIRNVTIEAAQEGIRFADGAGAPGELGIANSYVAGGVTDIVGACASNPVAVELARDAFDTFVDEEKPCGVTETAPSIPPAGAALTADDGILRPSPGSTLLDAGATDASTGSLDVEGQPRVLNGKPDIGADEVPVAAGVVSTGASDVTETAARLASDVHGRGADVAEVAFEYGITEAYGSTAPAAYVPNDGGPIIDVFPTYATTLDGLTPGVTYHARAVVTNEFGQVGRGPDVVFTTPGDAAPGGEDAPPPAPAPAPAPVTTPAGGDAADRSAPVCRVTLKRGRRRGRSRLVGRCSEAATLRITAGGRLVARVRVPAGSFRRTVRTARLRVGRRVRVVARDGAGNVAGPLRLRLRRR
ncbi:MAG TPA: hypothetical protein VF587_05920 [Solirubrobacteraceae bacterium]